MAQSPKFDGDWLAEVNHPWREQMQVAPTAISTRPRPWQRLLINAIAFLIPVALIVVGGMIVGRASAEQSGGGVAGPGAASTSPALPAHAPAKQGAKPSDAVNSGIDIPTDILVNYKLYGARYRVDWRLLAAIGANESNHGRSSLPGIKQGLNYAGCCAGIMQLCVVSGCGDTAGAYAVDGNGNGRFSIYESGDSIATAANLISDLRTMVGSSPRLLLAAYNAGPGAVQAAGGVPPYRETRRYVSEGMRTLLSLKATARASTNTGGVSPRP